jgi:hypothetical protein
MWLILCAALLQSTTTLAITEAPPTAIDPLSITKVHLVFSNHYDAGFADYASNILNRYVLGGPGTQGPPHPRNVTVHYDSFLLSAARTANALRAKNKTKGAPRFRYMTQAYIASYFLNCTTNYPKVSLGNPLKCPNASQLEEFVHAVQQGDIYWHAFPHNAEPELMTPQFLQYGIQFAQDLAASLATNDIVGVPAVPGVLSQRDVPGLTRAAIPTLVENGVIGISVGVNDGSPAPIVPSTAACFAGNRQIRAPFLWKDLNTKTEIIADYHPGGYGGILPQIPNQTIPYYSRDGVLCDCIGVPGLDQVLCYGWKGDNYGPANVRETEHNFELFGSTFPNADIVASTLSDYWKILNQNDIKNTLEVVTSEIGDTWIYGSSSDPLKLATMRYMMRARKEAVAAAAATTPPTTPPTTPRTTPPTTPLPPPPTSTVFYPRLANVSCYRIPSIIQTNGVLLAFAEARRNSGCSDNTAYSIAQRRSTDGGQTWSNVTFPVGSLSYMVGNPSSVALANGTAAIIYVRHSPTCTGDCGIGNGIVFSNDNGVSWSAPRDLSNDFGIAKGAMPGPGTALELTSGRILVVSHKGAYENDYVSRSDDHGLTFTTNSRGFPKMDEAVLTQLTNGSVLLNMRHRSAPSLGRGIAISHDDGATFGPITFDSTLISPVCQASCVSFGGATFFSNPADSKGRDKITIRKSKDNAQTWPEALLIHKGPTYGYSCLVKGELAIGPSHQGGLLFESVNKTIQFTRFNVNMTEDQTKTTKVDARRKSVASTAIDPGFDEFSRLLLKLPEHTWGSCGSGHMHVSKPESGSWKSKDLQQAILNKTNPFFQVVQESWDEQREFMTQARASLTSTTSNLIKSLDKSYGVLHQPSPTSANLLQQGYTAVASDDWEKNRTVGALTVRFNATTSSLSYLYNGRTNSTWTSSCAHPMFRFMYRSHSYEEAVAYAKIYKYDHGGKYPYRVKTGTPFPGMNDTTTIARQWYPTISGMFVKGNSLVLETSIPVQPIEMGYGAPKKVWLMYEALDSNDEGGGGMMNVELVWEGKSPTRLRESIWLEVRPDLSNEDDWKLYIDKIGQQVDASDVVKQGGAALHGMDPSGGVSLVSTSIGRRLSIASLDCGLVAPGSNTNIWNYTAYDVVPANPTDGFAFDLYSNLYAVNYPLWYPWRTGDDVSRFRFIVREM